VRGGFKREIRGEHDLHPTMSDDGHRKMNSSPPSPGARRWTWVSAMAGASALVSLAAVSTAWRDGTGVTGRRGGVVLNAHDLGGRRAKIAALAAKEKAKALDSGWSIAKMLKNGLDWDGKEDVETGHNVIMVSVWVHVHAACCDVGNGRASARRRSFRASSVRSKCVQKQMWVVLHGSLREYYTGVHTREYYTGAPIDELLFYSPIFSRESQIDNPY